MVTIRIRSMMWFTAGIVLALAMLVSMTTWRADALPGPEESTIISVTPTRVLDSRDPIDLGLAGPFASTVPQKLKITGSIPTADGTKTVVPTGSTGVLLNVTIFNPSADGFLSIRPGDATGVPSTSSLNFTAGQTVPNSVQVTVPAAGANAGEIDILYSAFGAVGPTADVLIDVVAYTTNTGLQEINTALGTKANASDVYTKAEVLAEIAKNQSIAKSVADTNVTDPTANTYDVILSTEITVPVAGVLQIDGSYLAATIGTAGVAFSCRLTEGAGTVSNVESDDLDDTDRHTTIDTTGTNGLCTTNGATDVTAGTYTINLVAQKSDVSGVMDDATLDVTFVPGTASSFTVIAKPPPELERSAE